MCIAKIPNYCSLGSLCKVRNTGNAKCFIAQFNCSFVANVDSFETLPSEREAYPWSY